MSQKIQKHGAQTACMAHTATCQTKKNNKYLTNLWYNCHNQSFVHVFSHRTFLCALQFRSFHLKSFFQLRNIFSLPVLLESFPVEAELYRDMSAVFRAMCIVWLIGVPILKIFFFINTSRDQGRAVEDKGPMTCPAKSLSSKIKLSYLCPSKKIEALHHVKLPGSRLEVSSWRPPISTRPLRRRRSRQSRTRTSHCSTWGQD